MYLVCPARLGPRKDSRLVLGLGLLGTPPPLLRMHEKVRLHMRVLAR